MAVLTQLVTFDKVSCYTATPGEADFIYQEIFEDRCYDIDGLPQTPLVIDVGANIGLFSLYAKMLYPEAKIIAFEPAPETFDTLRRNMKLHQHQNVELHNIGLASMEGEADFTFFPALPGNSTLKHAEKEIFYEECVQKNGREIANSLFGNHQVLKVELQRLSYFLKTIPEELNIDLIKIDVEGAELEVLKGVGDSDWKRLRKIILEIWEPSGTLNAIQDLLQSKGFTTVTKTASWSEKSTFFMVTATNF